MLTSRLPALRTAAVAAAALAVAACFTGPATASQTRPRPFTLTSPDFRDGGRLPAWTEYGGYPDVTGCNGKNLAPELDWLGAPAGTAGYALLVNDPDAPLAGGWHHWVLYDIPGAAHQIDGHGTLQFTQGADSFDVNGLPGAGWGGPCPPPTGQVHHYVFTLYALSVPTLPEPGLTYKEVTAAIEPSVLGATSIVGTFRLP
ncbi:YbhB/YbcL family Raf kinase inhibitor-like protein [Kitasatospora sp. NPDC002227]|uniref:YbhB/YbcL family Raf kinase inhibitor-like protein n=1 Tax=Kitasatospora sp. NPDC002227 TaxID=3154773 RepID=UPI0033283AC6